MKIGHKCVTMIDYFDVIGDLVEYIINNKLQLETTTFVMLSHISHKLALEKAEVNQQIRSNDVINDCMQDFKQNATPEDYTRMIDMFLDRPSFKSKPSQQRENIRQDMLKIVKIHTH